MDAKFVFAKILSPECAKEFGIKKDYGIVIVRGFDTSHPIKFSQLELTLSHLLDFILVNTIPSLTPYSDTILHHIITPHTPSLVFFLKRNDYLN